MSSKAAFWYLCRNSIGRVAVDQVCFDFAFVPPFPILGASSTYRDCLARSDPLTAVARSRQSPRKTKRSRRHSSPTVARVSSSSSVESRKQRIGAPETLALRKSNRGIPEQVISAIRQDARDTCRVRAVLAENYGLVAEELSKTVWIFQRNASITPQEALKNSGQIKLNDSLSAVFLLFSCDVSFCSSVTVCRDAELYGFGVYSASPSLLRSFAPLEAWDAGGRGKR